MTALNIGEAILQFFAHGAVLFLLIVGGLGALICAGAWWQRGRK